MGDLRGKRVLDLGCGDGLFSVILAKRGGIVDGIDISSVAIEIAKKRAVVNEVSNKTNFKVMSFYNLDYPDEYFDRIIGLSSLHHAEDKRLLSDSLFRVLKPGGRIVFREPFGNSKVLERLRLFVPIPVQEEDKTHWDEQIKYNDLEIFKNRFTVTYKEFQFLSRLDRIIKSANFVRMLGVMDLWLLHYFPFIKPFARDIVIVLDK